MAKRVCVDLGRASIGLVACAASSKGGNDPGVRLCANVRQAGCDFDRERFITACSGESLTKPEFTVFVPHVSCDYLFRIIGSSGNEVCKEELLQDPQMRDSVVCEFCGINCGVRIADPDLGQREPPTSVEIKGIAIHQPLRQDT